MNSIHFGLHFALLEQRLEIPTAYPIVQLQILAILGKYWQLNLQMNSLEVDFPQVDIEGYCTEDKGLLVVDTVVDFETLMIVDTLVVDTLVVDKVAEKKKPVDKKGLDKQ
jgi:hypothetical protein